MICWFNVRVTRLIRLEFVKLDFKTYGMRDVVISFRCFGCEFWQQAFKASGSFRRTRIIAVVVGDTGVMLLSFSLTGVVQKWIHSGVDAWREDVANLFFFRACAEQFWAP